MNRASYLMTVLFCATKICCTALNFNVKLFENVKKNFIFNCKTSK
jgi:hypothetical protein